MRRVLYYIVLAFITLVLSLGALINVGTSNAKTPDGTASTAYGICGGANEATYMNYLTSKCTNTLYASNDTISNLDCAASGGWITACVFQVNSAKNSAVFVASGASGGLKYDKATQLSDGTENATNPEIGANGDVVTVIYEAEKSPGLNEVYLRQSVNGGTNFSTAVNLSNSSDSNSVDSVLRLDGTKVLVAWVDQGASSIDDKVKAYCSHC